GSGNTIEKVSAAEREELLPGDRIILLTDEPEMPDITGRSSRDEMQLSKLMSLAVEPIGNGCDTNQSTKKGTPVKKNDYKGGELQPRRSDAEETEQSSEESSE